MGQGRLGNRRVFPALLAQTTNIDWPYYSNDLGGMRYVDIDQITPGNVSTLAPAWTFHTNVFNDSTSFEGQPSSLEELSISARLTITCSP